ncbi:MAG: TonB-dependent receptor [Spongiibacteraceae bacterium]|nr:TonB-dependent receptor [Spongiibacteraceae bacterium]
MKLKKLAAIIAGIQTLPFAATVSAQDESSNKNAFLEEVIVTAQKREQNVLEVPIAITIIGADQLRDQRITGIADLARTTPSLEMVQAFGGPGGGGQIRGIGTQSFTRSAEGAVGIVVDGVAQGNVPVNAVFDLERIEVLKGPQGTLFGLTASAGVINMTTVSPNTEEMEGYIQADFSPTSSASSEFGQQTLRGAINIPLTDNSAIRIAASHDEVEGVQYNAATGEEFLSKESSIRARYLLEASDTVTLNLIADYSKIDNNFATPLFSYIDVEEGTPLYQQLADCGITPSYDNNGRCISNPDESESDNLGFSGQVDIEFEAGTLTSITGYRKQETGPDSFDIMADPQNFIQIFSTNAVSEGTQISQEIRFTSDSDQAFEYTVGAFYSEYEGTSDYEGDDGGFFVGSNQVAPVFVAFHSENFDTKTTNESYAVFGQSSYHLTEQLSLLAGLRFTSQELSDYKSADPLDSAPAELGETSEDNVSGKIGLQYFLDNGTMFYTTFTRGYKGPQIIPATQGNSSTVIGAEIPEAFEVGAKGVIGDAIAYEASLFYSEVQDYQGQRCRINTVGALDCTGESISSIESKGFELNLFGNLTENLSVNAGYIYNIAEYPGGWTGFNPNDLRDPVAGTTIGTTDLSGAQIVGVPKNKLVLNAEYTIPFDGIDFFVGADAVYKSDVRLGPSADDRFVYPSDWTFSARLGLEDQAGVWSVQLFAGNITQNREPATIFGGPSFIGPDTVPFAPNGLVNGVSGWSTKASLRQVGLSTEYRF